MQMNSKILFLTGLLFMGNLLIVSSSHSAVGCTLNDPDRDIQRIFPQSTGYKTEFLTIDEHGGEVLAKEVEMMLKDKLDQVYETLDVPYAYYTVLKKKEIIGYVHGVNQRGMYGGMQLILATDLEGKILDFYYQKISSPEAKNFKDEEFTTQFVGLTLADFKNSLMERISNPSKESGEDYANTLRGLKKNLILFHKFKLESNN